MRIDPPAAVADQILGMIGEWPFPPLRGVIATQTMRYDGTLLTQPGYDRATGLVLFNPPPMPEIPASPPRPTRWTRWHCSATCWTRSISPRMAT